MNEMALGQRPPLELFLRDYVAQSGGVWEEIEPQVYDILLAGQETAEGEESVLRVTFDPEALPDHPGAQLAGFGTPLVDRLLSAAARRGRLAQAYRVGLNLAPHGLAARVARALTLPPGSRIDICRSRAMFFPQALFWFAATFVSDQKEHEILPMGFDLHYGRQVRHLDRLLDDAWLADEPEFFLADIKHATVPEIFPLARQEVIRTLASLANERARELNHRLERQVARMRRYYGDMLCELEEQQRRGQHRGLGPERFAARRDSLLREQQLRVAELQQKSTLRVHLRVGALLVVRQPKLRLDAEIAAAGGHRQRVELIWDPLIESLEAVPCPQCGRPTFALGVDRRRRLACPRCVEGPPDRGR